MYPESGDAPPIHRHDFHFSPRDRDPVTHAWEASQLCESESSERRPVAVGNLDAIVRTDIDQRQRSRELQHAICHYGFARGEVVFVGDVSDDFLDEVLHRDDARGAAVLVQHDSHMRPGFPQIVEHSLRRTAVGHVHRLAHEVGEIERRVT